MFKFFIFLTQFLNSRNKYDFGERQDGKEFENVQLPPWANHCYEKFIFKNLEALESKYVSENLHEWINLIFGYKQKGDAAEKADNVFCYLTYEVILV